MVVVTVKGESYYMNPKNKEIWDDLRGGRLSKYDEDRVYVVDGREGTGKSVFTLQQAAYIDPTVIDNGPNGELLPRITFSVDETLKVIRNTRSTDTHTKVIIFDEAFRGLSSKAALSKTNKALVQTMMEMRQNNLVLFIVAPSFFLLEMYPAVLRSHALFHISKDKNSRRRSYRAFNYQKKARIYQIGIRKGWSYPAGTKNRDWFFNKYPGGKEFEERYRKKKYDSLREVEQTDDMNNSNFLTGILINYLKEKKGINLTEQHKIITEEYNYKIGYRWIAKLNQKADKYLKDNLLLANPAVNRLVAPQKQEN